MEKFEKRNQITPSNLKPWPTPYIRLGSLARPPARSGTAARRPPSAVDCPPALQRWRCHLPLRSRGRPSDTARPRSRSRSLFETLPFPFVFSRTFFSAWLAHGPARPALCFGRNFLLKCVRLSLAAMSGVEDTSNPAAVNQEEEKKPLDGTGQHINLKVKGQVSIPLPL